MKQILETRNYDLFKKIKGNRDVSIERVNKIKKSIRNVGYITSPILVNENMEIIDGQGRYEALKDLKLPIEYIVQEGININECISMNIYQTRWSQMDYIKSYADRNNINYIRIMKLFEKYTRIKNLSIISMALTGNSRFDSILTQRGGLQISEEQYNQAIEKIDFIYPILTENSTVIRVSNLIVGVLACFEIPDVNMNRLKEKVMEYLRTVNSVPYSSIIAIMQFIEELYNKNSKKSTVYIFTEYRKNAEKRMKEHNRDIETERFIGW